MLLFPKEKKRTEKGNESEDIKWISDLFIDCQGIGRSN